MNTTPGGALLTGFSVSAALLFTQGTAQTFQAPAPGGRGGVRFYREQTLQLVFNWHFCPTVCKQIGPCLPKGDFWLVVSGGKQAPENQAFHFDLFNFAFKKQ